MRVWIDQELCTGDGLCEETCPSLFELHDDALAYVKEIGQVALCDEQGQPIHQGVNGKVAVPTELEKAVREAVEDCPGECIFIET
ncbi:MAG TPA: ferredoxin [Candidatus Saccharimonadales bacterium]|jgi:ferredoxin|nr:ferredoxin [Candidatus Saccharimonadales bacterium]